MHCQLLKFIYYFFKLILIIMEAAKKKKKIKKETASSFNSKLTQKVPKIKRFQWSNIVMKNAIAAVENSLMSQREAALQFSIPRSTLGKYFRGDLILRDQVS